MKVVKNHIIVNDLDGSQGMEVVSKTLEPKELGKATNEGLKSYKDTLVIDVEVETIGEANNGMEVEESEDD